MWNGVGGTPTEILFFDGDLHGLKRVGTGWGEELRVDMSGLWFSTSMGFVFLFFSFFPILFSHPNPADDG